LEAWHLTLTEPVTGRGLWVRTGIVAPADGPPTGTSAIAVFHPSEPRRTFGIQEANPGDDFTVGGQDRYLRSGAAEVGPGFVRGTLGGGGHEVRWDLTYVSEEPTYALLPDLAAAGPFGAAAALVTGPGVRVSGEVRLDGETLTLEDVSGSQGHVYGARYPERWVWARCSSFEDEDAVLEAFTGRVRRGPYVTPYLTTIGLRRQGRWMRFTRLRTRRDFSMGSWRIDASDRRFRLTGRVEAPTMSLVRSRLDGPDGTVRNSHQTANASCRLALFERRTGGFEEVAVLESRGMAQAEWAGRTPAAAVEHEAAGA
jgi:hypothetical protein